MSAPAASASWRRSGRRRTTRRCRARVDYLLREQEADGSWFGRWGTNYIYGTWSVLAALNAAGIEPDTPRDSPRRRVAGCRGSATTAAGAKPARATVPDAPRGEAPYSTRLADRLGIAGADGGRRGRQSGRRARHRLSDRDARTQTATGTSPGTRRSGSRACSTCAITATARSSRYGRWRATAASRWPIPGASRSGCDIAGLSF